MITVPCHITTSTACHRLQEMIPLRLRCVHQRWRRPYSPFPSFFLSSRTGVCCLRRGALVGAVGKATMGATHGTERIINCIMDGIINGIINGIFMNDIMNGMELFLDEFKTHNRVLVYMCGRGAK